MTIEGTNERQRFLEARQQLYDRTRILHDAIMVSFEGTTRKNRSFAVERMIDAMERGDLLTARWYEGWVQLYSHALHDPY